MSLPEETPRSRPRRSRRLEQRNRIIDVKVCSCTVCRKPDSDNMVQCDQCNAWYHFICVNVTSAVESEDWICGNCERINAVNQQSPKKTHSKKTKSTARSSHAKFELQKLEESRNLQLKRDEEARVLQAQRDEEARVLQAQRDEEIRKRDEKQSQLQAKRDEEYLKQKYAALEDLEDQEESESSSEESCHQQVSEWIVKSRTRQVYEAEQQQVYAANNAATALNAIIPNYHTEAVAHISQSNTQPILQPTKPNLANLGATVSNPQRETKSFPNDYNAFKPQVNVIQNEDNKSLGNAVQTNPYQSEFLPLTNRQLAARQSVSKELPLFHGNTEEWPLFVSIFEGSTQMCGFSNDENLLRLQRCLKGRALEAVRSRLLLPSNVPSIMSTLRMLYGRSDMIIQTLLQKIRAEPMPRVDKLDSVIVFALAVQNLHSTMEACKQYDHLANPMLLQELVDKLPAQLKINWADHKKGLSTVNFSAFNAWLYQLAETISGVMPAANLHAENKIDKRKNEKGHVHTHAEEDQKVTPTRNRQCQICKQSCNSVENCRQFRNMNRNERWDAVKQHRLCRKCLTSHFRNPCRVNKLCGISGCTYRHHHLLHKNTNELNAAAAPFRPPPNPIACTEPTQIHEAEIVRGIEHNCNCTHGSSRAVKYRVVPVILHNNDAKLATYAFLDDGSSLTMMESSLATELNLKGEPKPLHLRWTGNAERYEHDSQVVSVEISGSLNPNKRYPVPVVRTVKSLNLPQQSLDVKEMCAKYPHLRGYPIEPYEHAVPRILIGLDNLNLAIPLKVIEGAEGDPVATKTRLGWVAYGPSSPETNDPGESSDHQTFHHCYECQCGETNDNELHTLMKNYFSLDGLGVVNPVKLVKSVEEERACEILETQTIRIGNRFQTSLLWKYDDVQLPNNLPMALRRYECLRKKLTRETELAENLKSQLEDYLVKGYIRRLSEEEIHLHHPRKWYLPIFTVTNQNKPGKIRIVWDAAAKTNGISLNSTLLKGPDQLVSLLTVLYRFQERHIAICADIREMFHRILVKSEDQQAQRFLWSQDLSEVPDTYVMRVLTFGATCSPSCAQFAKNKNAQEFAEEYPRAVTSILQSHYVDDLLDSVDTEEEAVKLAQEVKLIHQNGGFEIRNWISNSSKVIEALGEKRPDEKRAMSTSPDDSAEKVLGMWWCISSDSFTFALSSKASMNELLTGDVQPTKRQVLRVLMTIFDPLGLIANFLVYIKILMQEIWRSKLEWDEPINTELYEKWRLWVKHLKNINQVQIRRCYCNMIKFGEHDTSQLHIFVDASINAYAAVAFIRITKGDHIECRIIAAKTRVAPISLISIPRLELEAARLGARLASSIKVGHTIQFNDEFYWSDSKTVLSWIQSDSRKYRQFVGFRVSEILEMTEMHQWRYVPTKMNVADDATKWQKVPDFSSSNRWYMGPSFLMQSEEKWPPMLKDLHQTSEELKPSILFHHLIRNAKLLEPERFSNWNRLLRTQAFVSRFVYNISAKRKGVSRRSQNYFTKEEYLEAGNSLYRQAQYDSYPDEIADLRFNSSLPVGERKTLDKSSKIRQLSPYLDRDGVLRIRGRIDAATGACSYLRRPIILPKGHYITSLVIKHYHEMYHHCNHETVINEIHQKFWIPNLRVAVRSERRRCQYCKNQLATPKPPEMGDLPPARLSSFTRAFTYIGIDYFGPMSVTIGRRTEKRWGVLITCMTTRAVHIEVANSLTSDSCILAIKRFIARRGIPCEIRCDNGTNFHGAERELREVLTPQLQTTLANEFSSPITKWIFNPPASPHMGGSWERLVQSVKKILYRTLPTRSPSDELLHSMLVEVERIINCRPLTYIPIECDGDEVLTPNHFLLGSSNGEKPDGIECDDGILLKRNWLKSQQFANIFWKRWIREYLPHLTRRTKWYQPVKPIEIGDIVIIVDDASPRNTWPKGRVISTTCGKDGQVRRATVQTATSIYERPAVKLAVLDVRG